VCQQLWRAKKLPETATLISEMSVDGMISAWNGCALEVRAEQLVKSFSKDVYANNEQESSR
jgi:hypothetical protein